MLLPALGQPLPEALGRRVAWQGGCADRLAEEGRHGLRAGLVQDAVERFEGRLPARVEVPGRGRDVQVRGEVRRVVVVKPRPSGEGKRRDRRPMVGLRRGDNAPAIGLAALHVVAPGQAHGGLVGLGAAGHEVDPREAFRRECEQLARQLLLRRGRELLVVEKRDAARLLAGRLDELGDAVTYRGDHRAAADGVEVCVSRRIVEPDALRPVDQGVGAVELAEEDARLRLADEDGLAHGPTGP